MGLKTIIIIKQICKKEKFKKFTLKEIYLRIKKQVKNYNIK